MARTSPFWPVGAPERQIPNVNDPQIDPVTGLATNFVTGGAVNWRQIPAGKRTSGNVTTTDRTLIDLTGTVLNWDYKTAIGSSRSKSTERVKKGYVNDDLMGAGVFNGIINPFGDQTAAGTAAIEAAQVAAPVMIGKNQVDFADFVVSGDLMQMPAGPLSVAFGIEARHEKSSFEATDITGSLSSLGIDPNSDTAGSRNSKAVFAELNVPFAKGFDATVAARYDRYSDFGSTFNPKLGLRFQPSKEFLMRGSFNKGFRAPTLYEIYQPASLTFTTDNHDDPLLCPNGVPVAGASAGVVCGQQVLQVQAGPAGLGLPASTLKPEKSQTWSLGAVLDPTPSLSFSADYYSILVKNLISGLPEQAIFGDPTKYADRFVRCSALPISPGGGITITPGDVNACASATATMDPIAYINSPNANLGDLKTTGIDLSALWRIGAGPAGRFAASIEGTYVTSYKYQRLIGGEFIDALGRYSDNAPVFKWQHVLSFNWSTTDWAVTVGQRYKSGYTDQDPAEHVEAYSTYDVSGTWTGIKGLSVTASIQNLLDTDPPVTTQNTTFQRGYDPRFTDPLGRTFGLRIGYKF